MTKTAVVIVNWNGKKYLKDCFDSLAAQTDKNFKIIFVDNGSTDGSADYLETEFPSVEIIKLAKNTGFCFGYNTGIEKALEDKNIEYIVVLNNDTKLDERYIEELTKCAGQHPNAGSIQPKVVNFFEPGKIDCAGILISRDGTAHNRGYGKSAENFNDEKEIFGANGTASLFTREALEKTRFKNGEYFDNSHFAFYEDVDLAWRIRRVGLKSYYCPQALVQHVHSGTAGRASLLKAYYLHRNYFFTVIKNYSFGKLIKIFFWRFLSYIQLALNVFKKKKRETEFVKGHSKARVTLVILKAWGSVIVNLPSLMRKRMSIRKKTVVAAIVLAMVGLFPFASNAFGVAFLSDIHASGKKKTATEGGNIIFPKNYKRCLAEVKDQKPDLVIAAGDLTDRGEKKYYRSLRKSMQGTRVLWAKGNHDGSRFNLLSEENYFIDFDGWRFIVLDSSRQFGSSTGFLENFQLSLLEEWLDTDKNIAIVMHHPPFFYNSRAGIYTEKKETVHDNFFNVLTPNVKYVLSGHWHFEKTAKIGDTTFLIQKALTQNNECNFTILELESNIPNNG